MTKYLQNVVITLHGVVMHGDSQVAAERYLEYALQDWINNSLPVKADLNEIKVIPIGSAEDISVDRRHLAYELAELFYYSDDERYGTFDEWAEGIDRIEKEISTESGIMSMQGYLQKCIDQDDFGYSDSETARDFIKELSKMLAAQNALKSGSQRSVKTPVRKKPVSRSAPAKKAPAKRPASKSIPAKAKAKAPAEKAPAKKPATRRH